MSSTRKIAKNTGLLFFSEFVNKGISLLLLVFIARKLGEAGYGQYTYAFAFIGLFTTLSNLGMEVYLLKELAKRGKENLRLLGNAAGLRVVSLALAYGCALGIAFFLPKAGEIILILLLAVLCEALTALTSLYLLLFKAYERNELTVVGTMLDRLLAVASTVIALGLWNNLLLLLCVLAIGRAASFAAYAILARKKIGKIPVLFEVRTWGKILKNSLSYWAIRLFQTLYSQIDRVMLAHMTTFAVTGWYSAAASLIDGLFFIPLIIMYATFPAMSRLFVRKNKEKLMRVYEKAVYTLLILSLPLATGVILLSDRIIGFIYHGQFLESGVILQMLAITLIFLFLNYILGFLLNAIDKQRLFTFAAGISAVLNIGLNLFLIPAFAHKGAALATMITQTLNFVLIYVFTAKNGYTVHVLKLAIKPGIAALGMGCVVWWFSAMPVIGSVVLGILVYGVLLGVMRGIPKEELDLVFELLRFKQASK